VFDPRKVSYEKLVEHFWRTIDPTTKDRQFCDAGSPYRTAIYAQDAAQLKAAQASRQALDKSKPFKEPIVTEVVMGGPFYRRRGLSPGLLQEEPGPLQLLPPELRARRPPQGTVGQPGGEPLSERVPSAARRRYARREHRPTRPPPRRTPRNGSRAPSRPLTAAAASTIIAAMIGTETRR
jgi:hypothetical protein